MRTLSFFMLKEIFQFDGFVVLTAPLSYRLNNLHLINP